MEMKWLAIMVIGLFGAMFMGLGAQQYGENQCRIEAIKAGVEADKIKTACGIK